MHPPAQTPRATDTESLLDELRPRLVRILRRYRIPPEDAEDLLQETLLLLVRRRAQIRHPEHWLPATLANVCIAHHRRRRRTAAVLDLVDPDVLAHHGPADPPAQAAVPARLSIARLLSDLTPTHRRLLRLAAQGLDTPELARRLGYAPSSVRTLLSRLRRRLRRRYDAGS